MNKDQVKGAAKQAAGKVQAGIGKMVGSRAQEAKGQARQAAGKLQKTMGDVKEATQRRSGSRHH